MRMSLFQMVVNLTKESVVVGIVDMFNVSLVDYFESDMSGLKDTSEWSEPMRMSAKKIKFGKFGVEFEIADKMAIADKIINIMQYVAPAQNEVVDHGLSKYTDKELAEMKQQEKWQQILATRTTNPEINDLLEKVEILYELSKKSE